MKNDEMRRTLRFLQWTALTFILTLGLLLAYDMYRSRAPIKQAQDELADLKQQDLADAELAKTVRDLDYLYRSAYFQTKDKQRRGVLLLGIAFFLLCGLFGAEMFWFAPKLKVPRGTASVPEKERRQLLIFASCGIVVMAVALAVLRIVLVPSEAKKPAQIADAPNTTAEQSGKAKPVQTETIDLLAALEAEKTQWPQFRGSTLPNSNALPASWDFQRKWSSPIELSGNNSPVIWDDLVFLSGGDGKSHAVFCYDANSGEPKWKTAAPPAANMPEVTEDTGYAAPTMCADSKRVYAVFATGQVLCLAHDGTLLWHKQLPDPVIMYGYASSPLLMGDKLVVQYDMDEKQTIFALNVFTGETMWQTERESAQSWSSPKAVVADGKGMVFTAGNMCAELFDLETGKRLWSQDCMGGEVAASASVRDGKIFFSNSGAFTGALGVKDGEILFRNDDSPAPDVASAVLFGDQYLLFGSGGTIIAIDAADGHELYEEDLDNGFYASPVTVGGKVVAVDLDGVLYQFEPEEDEIEIRGKFELGKKVVCVPAFHKGNIILRTAENELICLEAKQ
ncbi:MAG: PQQ-binding-like beta-propeller repeat protein [Lentisphaeria bacterium]|nr:PQQ-binding-like beta-propeller repeat protein [Lentisphaeria bacterium]MBR3687777.1 PQQ-binding-like beta-propeller repeat protein [Lentisphaeria bacterium]